ncbi:TetR/AcrR family transcriptional regulator [Skermanella rosea]|uniref:TetR/AcrR family transcriptional regulator n=1 Tax=Skermanella rosea TaxID=1817965 RepID=UPI001E43D01B|nr:TetR/AcrR family transcriptional regulator [Skermanella rosea]UEM05424.1 TetR/AcrR family transcriptional regulator [Skermanella rosea]
MGDVMNNPAASGAAPAPRGRIRRENETRILEAAERVFAETGLAGATMAQIAQAAGLPKANLHYYFGTKEQLYQAVLTGILELWLDATDMIRPESDPAEAISGYVRAKMRHSRHRPLASKVFANELLSGAPFLTDYLEIDLRKRVEAKSRIIAGWIAEGRMAALDPRHLFFMLWGMTQTYADFAVQIRAVMEVESLSDAAWEEATAEVVAFVLRGCGIGSGSGPSAGEAR